MSPKADGDEPWFCGHGINVIINGCRRCEAETAALLARTPNFALALEAEWYNGNLTEDTYRRLCGAAGLKPYPSASRRVPVPGAALTPPQETSL